MNSIDLSDNNTITNNEINSSTMTPFTPLSTSSTSPASTPSDNTSTLDNTATFDTINDFYSMTFNIPSLNTTRTNRYIRPLFHSPSNVYTTPNIPRPYTNSFFQPPNTPNTSNILDSLEEGIHTTFDSILQQSFETNEPAYINVISHEGLEMLQDISYNSLKQTTTEKPIQRECCITGDKFQENETVTLLPCQHIFSKDAIYTWLTKHSNECPICRYSLPSKEIKNENNQENEDYTNNNEEYDTDDTYEDDTNDEDVPNNNEDVTDEEEQTNTISNIDTIHTHPSIVSPFSQLLNRRIIPHSYIRQLIEQQNESEDDYILQQAILNSLER